MCLCQLSQAHTLHIPSVRILVNFSSFAALYSRSSQNRKCIRKNVFPIHSSSKNNNNSSSQSLCIKPAVVLIQHNWKKKKYFRCTIIKYVSIHCNNKWIFSFLVKMKNFYMSLVMSNATQSEKKNEADTQWNFKDIIHFIICVLLLMCVYMIFSSSSF